MSMDLQKRVVGILTAPQQEWPVIASEPADVPTLYRSYIAILAAIPAIAIFLGLMVIGMPIAGRFGMSAALSAGLSTYVSSLVTPLIAAIVIAKLAPSFQSISDITQALKLVAYASTPGWIAGVLYLVFALSPLVLIAALYGIYLFYLGLPVVMKTPQDKVVPFMVVAALIVIVVSVVLNVVLAGIGTPRYGL
jgi:hypothetical protein